MHRILVIVFLLSGIIFPQTSLNRELDDIKKQIQDQLDRSEIEEKIDIDAAPVISEPVKLTNPIIETDDDGEFYFGYDYFKREINFFDNTPTPSDYRLGPGDEITLSLWGEHNLRETFLINKEGLIYYENIGFINLSNITISESEKLLKDKLSAIYATLSSSTNSTKLMVELGKIKSINVYFSGELSNPGIHLVHPFSDIFGAIVQSGGVKNQGSLRNIKIIRSGKTIASIDFYDLFTKGINSYSSLKLIEGDMIYVPTINNRIYISGEVNRSGYYELLENEHLGNLIDYAGGLTAMASSTMIVDKIIPIENRLSDDNATSSMNVNFKESNIIALNDGDVVEVNTIGIVESKVEILGKVKNPGSYSAVNSSLKNILDIAGGFDDPIFRKSILDDDIVVMRKDIDQFYGLEFHISYNESDNFMLNPEDKIFVYENSNYNNIFSVSISGQVNKRGTFPAKKGMTVQDIVNLAGGLTKLANPNGIIVRENFTSIDDSGTEIEERTQINDAKLDFELSNGATINVLPFENVVSVEGNVYDPGLVVYSSGQSLKKYINFAGGPKPDTLTNRIYVKRANGRTKKVSLFRGLGIRIKPGDTIFVPLDPDPQDFDITTFIADLSTTLANIAAILLIVDNQD